MSRDRRDSYRLTVPDGDVRIRAPALTAPLELADLSASGGGLLIPRTRFDLLEDLSGAGAVEVQLGSLPAFCTAVQRVRVYDDAGVDARIGVRFGDLDAPALKTLSRYLIERFVEKGRSEARLRELEGRILAGADRSAIRRLLTYHTIRHGHPLQVYHQGAPLPLLLRARTFSVESAREILLLEVTVGDGRLLTHGEEYRFSFSGVSALNTFESAIWRTEKDRVAITLPPAIRQLGFRDSLRTPVTPQRALLAQISRAMLAGAAIERPVLDVSAHGLSFPLQLNRDVLFPGEHIPSVLLDLPDGPVAAAAVVRSIHNLGQQVSCGLELTAFAEPAHAERWYQFAFHNTYERLRLGDSQLVAANWQTLEASEYVDEATPALRPLLKRRFMRSWRQHADRPALGRFFLFVRGRPPQEPKLVATLSANLLYPATWLVHQLGVDANERRLDRQGLFDIAREVYSGIIYLLQHLAELEHFVLYVNADKAWTEMMYGTFLRRYPEPKDFVYDGFKVYKCVPTGELPPIATDVRDVQVVDASPKLLRRLARHLRTAVPKVEFDAYAYTEQAIDLVEFSGQCAASGYERSRAVFVATRADRPVAALIAETGDEGGVIHFPVKPPKEPLPAAA